MTPLPAVMNSVEKLGYRVTVGDVAAKAGLEINLAQQQLLALASEAGGHLQVAETGDIVYLFPRNFRGILRNKYWQLRLQQWWQKIWKVLFYLIRISFGIILILSILLMLVAIAVIVIAITSSGRDENSGGGGRSSDGANFIFLPRFWIGPDFWWFFNWDYGNQPRRYRQASSPSKKNEMNFLEGIFSFLFGDGNPNANLEERRWEEIGTVIRNNGGAVVAQQVAPYLDDADDTTSDNEDYMLPVLSRFNGYPEVSDKGEIIYYFPELQVTARQQQTQPVQSYLKEKLWRFSAASSGQIMGAIGLGCLNFVLALVLGYLLQGDLASELGGLVAFVDSIFVILLGYATAFLAIPLIRYFWLQGKNKVIQKRNEKRQTKAIEINQASDSLLSKINYARQFAAQKVIDEEDITYSTEKDLLEQNLEQADKIDQEWQRRLDGN